MTTAELLQKKLGVPTLEVLSKRLGFDVTQTDYRTEANLIRILDKYDGYTPKHPRHGWMTG
jgi:hypothetical protein